MRIGELSRRSGASVRSLRYYESRGLISAERSTSGQRHFSEDAVARVETIRRLLAAGLGTATIADVLPCVADPATQTTVLTQRLINERDKLTEDIEQRIETRDALERLIQQAPRLP
ncbi:MAG TPA: MerR family transcriptional regulator [Candidatus Agrococcus pullicola]|uniref:MerR family transcriptional regulator n=1 Tax=Candidatus Agrococcus pullicola TaxID=2838429 RepID=A0A9D1YWH2_9MICO|nr:MerR family transcriptional regulator [Candidatus Agrococcus pullicola]